jgi:hypothetical protein
MNKLPLITAALVAAGLVSSASAQTVVRITGSTAFRANINRALKAGTGIFDAAPTVVGTTYADGASKLVFSGTISTAPVIIKTSFTGSEAGIAALANVAVPNNVPGQPAANLPGTPKPTFLDTVTGLTANDVSSPDISMADTSQVVSLTQGGGVVDKGIVGVVQFVWMKAKNNGQPGWSKLSNVNIPQLNVLLGSGAQDISFLTGNLADAGNLVAVVGRNKGSGTRVNTMIQALYGVGKSVIQYAVNPTYTSGVLVNASAATPINDSAIKAIANDGFDSGSGVANTLNMTAGGGALTTIPIGYLGLNDAIGVQALNADGVSAPSGGSQQYLTVNGVAYSDNAISVGAYDHWGHEHVLTGSFTSATGQTVATALVAQIPVQTTGGIFGIKYITSGANQTMFADRPAGGDTGFVSQL